VKNTFDFYTLLCNFFTNQLLADILNDNEVSEEVEQQFKSGLGDIRKQFGAIKDSLVFEEWKLNNENALENAEERFDASVEKIRDQLDEDDNYEEWEDGN
jgi:DNA-binding transcriptional regulator GbsR (MarR family)